MLEHVIATIVLQFAYLATGIALSLIGNSLIQRGLKARFEFKGQAEGRQVSLVTTSPGLVFLVAGLAIVVVGVFRTSEYQQATYGPGPVTTPALVQSGAEKNVPAPQPGQVQKDEPKPGAVVQMLVQLTKYKFLETSGQAQLGSQLLASAAEARERGDVAAAREYMARAVGLDPRSYQNIRDADTKALLNTPEFQEYLHARLRLALAVQTEQPLSAYAEQVLSVLNIHAMATPPPSDPSETQGMVAAMPKRPGREPVDRTVERLMLLAQKNPRALHTLLSNPEYRWLLHDPTVFGALKAASDRFFRSGT